MLNPVADWSGALLAWFDHGHRILPWREDPSPYRVWISEIMLQQTRVQTVIPYFEQFVVLLPTVADLATVEDDVLLKLWEGLGYYSRARNLKKAAIQIQINYGGELPSDYASLRKLSGIGDYTAGAIASIAFGQAVPAIDGNVLRVLTRLYANDQPIDQPQTKIWAKEIIETILPTDRPGVFNQALMELGAVVCMPNGSPNCPVCPLCEICKAHRGGHECTFPIKKSIKRRTIQEKTVLLIHYQDRVAIHKRPARGLLAGLYEFPNMEGYATDEDVVRYLQEHGLRTLRIQETAKAKHIFTHIEWHMKGFSIRVDELARETPPRQSISDEWLYVGIDEIVSTYPIPSAFEAYKSDLTKQHMLA
jgi:A/G-specific adenine glycosylase